MTASDLSGRDELVCPQCKTTEDLVVTGIDIAAMLGRYEDAETNLCRWSVTCFACKSRILINDEARDLLFGTRWRGSDVSK